MPRRVAILFAILVLTWAGLTALYGQTPAPRVGCRVADRKIFIGGSTQFAIFADQLPPLTAYTLTLFYSPLFVQFSDQDLNLAEINLLPGSASPAAAITRNVVNPILGQIQLAATSPITSYMTGSNDLVATGIIQGVGLGIARFEFSNTNLLNHNGAPINTGAYARENCWVEVGDSGTPTPQATATYLLAPLLTATPTPPDFTLTPRTPTSTPTISPLPTPSPLQTPTLTPLPTAANTAIPTSTPLPTLTPTDTATPLPTPTDTETPTPTVVIITVPGSGEQGGQSPLETPIPFVEETPTETPVPTPSETPTETFPPTETPTVEVVPPTETPTPTSTPSPTGLPPPPTPTPSATSIPQAERALGETVQVMGQSTPPTQIAQRQPYAFLAAAALFGGLALLLAFWQLRQRG